MKRDDLLYVERGDARLGITTGEIWAVLKVEPLSAPACFTIVREGRREAMLACATAYPTFLAWPMVGPGLVRLAYYDKEKHS